MGPIEIMRDVHVLCLVSNILLTHLVCLPILFNPKFEFTQLCLFLCMEEEKQ